MRLINYLNEKKEWDREEFEEKLFPLIKKNCSQYLKELKKSKGECLLFRGWDGKLNGFDIKTPRKDRLPRLVPEYLHVLLDEELKKRYGWKVRSEGVFTGNRKSVGHYGNLHFIIPFDGYKYIWGHTDNLDRLYRLYDNFTVDAHAPLELRQYTYPDYTLTPDGQEMFDRLISCFNEYSDKNISKLKQKEFFECIVKCKKYIIVDAHLFSDCFSISNYYAGELLADLV